MHNLFAGLMGVFATFGSFFHGGQPVKQPATNTVSMNATVSGTLTQGRGVRGMMNQHGERAFFGTVTAVNGSTLTLERQRPFMMMMQSNTTITPTITPPAPKSMTITLDSATTYAGGAQSDITTGTKIAGIGKPTSDTAITAVKITINPTIPTGFPNGMLRGRGFHPNGPQGNDINHDNDSQ